MTRFEIVVDEENNAEEFWDALADHGGGGFAAPINALLRDGRVVVENEAARDALLSWFGTMPGWETGPEYARRPVCVSELPELPTTSKPFFLAPATRPTDEYAAGYEGNGFDTKEEAEAAIPGLRACGADFDVEWVVSRRESPQT